MIRAERSPRRGAGGWLGRHRRRSAQPTESWSGTGERPRVLVECPDSAMTWAMERVLDDAGFEVASCAGPSGPSRCALIETGHCDLQAGADVVVNCLGGRGTGGPAIARRTSETRPEIPLIVGASPNRAPGDLPWAASVLNQPWQAPTLVAMVDDVLDHEHA